jgi:hypothetical protein
MKLRTADLYYGAVLNRIAAFPILTEVHQVGHHGYYEINGEQRLLVKYSVTPGPVWRFTFGPGEKAVLPDSDGYETWVALVCGTAGICSLNLENLREIVDLDSTTAPRVSVGISPGRSMKVTGALGQLSVRQNAFPADMLAAGREPRQFSLPPLCQLRVYHSTRGLAYVTEDPFFDFADHLTRNVGRRPKVVYIGLLTRSPDWHEWTAANLQRVENAIRHDFAFDGYDVRIERVSPEREEGRQMVPLCSSEFIWTLAITVMR